MIKNLSKHLTKNILLVLSFCYLAACSSIPPEQHEHARENINSSATSNLEQLIKDDPAVKKELEASLGYFVSTGWTGMAGLIGRTDTIGVLFDKRDNSEVYLDLEGIDLGIGIGSADISIIVLFSSAKALDEFKQGQSYIGSTAVSIAGSHSSIMHFQEEGLSAYIISAAGVGLSVGETFTHSSINEDLNDMGISEINVPVYSKNLLKENKKRYWNRALPLFGQAVVDKGYSLPLPLGIDFIYATMQQEMYLADLSVGFNGAEKQPYEFVSFENGKTDTQTAQIKFDMWLMPFMNLFTSIGKVKGDASLDVYLDGDMMLEAMGKNCDGSRPDLRVCNFLQGRNIHIPVEPKVDVSSLTVGTVLAGGWEDWFAVLPLSWSMVEQKGFVAGGLSFNASPRVGRAFSLPNYGRLSLFVGGNYLASNLEVDGEIVIPEAELTLSYTLNQKTKDRWNGIAGFNWDITKKLSWSAEYNGFVGSRESFLTGLTVRY